MIFETKRPIRKYELTKELNRLHNPNIQSVVVFSDRDKKSVETMTKVFLQKKSPFTVFFVKDN